MFMNEENEKTLRSRQYYDINSTAIAKEYGILHRLERDYPNRAAYFVAFNGNVSIIVGPATHDYEEMIREKAKSAFKSDDENNPMIDMYETI
jgi:hypothetical protein